MCQRCFFRPFCMIFLGKWLHLISQPLVSRKCNFTMETVRDMFDSAMDDFPSLKNYISPNEKIVAHPAFENALVKLEAGASLTTGWQNQYTIFIVAPLLTLAAMKISIEFVLKSFVAQDSERDFPKLLLISAPS
ncbi:hypothetical protein AC1031_020678 [Aphanomyces cochlioides]|nr:hypothetical protein AC1031_020678 [Aphanomyces cochlioides]